jgi:four helix bundle protein
MPLDHERLIVYQRSLAFIAWASALCKEVGPCGDVRNQLDRASTSVPLNIAEGNGKFSIRDRVKYLDIAYGSALECSACLDVMVAKSVAIPARVSEGKQIVEEIVNRLVRLRESIAAREVEERSSNRVREGSDDGWFSLREMEEDS